MILQVRQVNVYEALEMGECLGVLIRVGVMDDRDGEAPVFGELDRVCYLRQKVKDRPCCYSHSHTWTSTLLARGSSNSQKNMPCQVPSARSPS